MRISDSQPPVLRQFSVRAVIDVLLHQGPTSRADLAKITGLSKQTMSEVIRALEEGGWVRERGKTGGHVGRRAVTYEIDPDAGYVAGIDFGVSSLRAVLADLSGRVLVEVAEQATPRPPEEPLSQLHLMLQGLIRKAELAPEKLLFAAVAMPGVIDPESGRLALAPNLEDMSGFDIAGALSERLGCDVAVENDINAGALGEAWLGEADRGGTFAFVSLGAGVGLGLLVNGKLMRGSSGAAGEIGFLPFGADPTAPESLKRGTLESALGTKAILEAYVREGGSPFATVANLFEQARAGQKAAVSIVGQVADLAALTIVAVSAFADPGKIVVGGPIGRQPILLPLIRESLKKITARKPLIEASRLGERAILMGAMAIALQQTHNLLFSPHSLPTDINLPAPPRG
ncbi:ROK family transcriptional regulator [Rhizobium sp. NRK18]|uniref:ROK family transcriptional regulator n=1 Tax=Rhizobium sp. NRK18 TaxID=2964667 RepID=UPI0021C28A65|nr:ROK family transcriptional regulator [Rhizobium sp. NRK18]MCQ2002942.1 ROK family transcriptional regulator [Rhizobium sp. NRK18]